MRVARWLCLVLIACFSARVAAADYIDGEVRAHLRAGPGLEFRILKILPAGTPVQKLGREGDWIHVRMADLEGWIPDGFVSTEEPATALLPRAKEKLVSAEGRITELDQKLSAQTAELEQLSSLRERNQVLEADVSRINASARWKSLTAGAGILLVGILIGLIAPRGGGTRSRLKL
ncbi:MAG: TIGR04211 family SH3 domain-containing protein [Myxococcota bacterium]